MFAHTHWSVSRGGFTNGCLKNLLNNDPAYHFWKVGKVRILHTMETISKFRSLTKFIKFIAYLCAVSHIKYIKYTYLQSEIQFKENIQYLYMIKYISTFNLLSFIEG